jgi:hypothetical protein
MAGSSSGSGWVARAAPYVMKWLTGGYRDASSERLPTSGEWGRRYEDSAMEGERALIIRERAIRCSAYALDSHERAYKACVLKHGQERTDGMFTKMKKFAGIHPSLPPEEMQKRLEEMNHALLIKSYDLDAAYERLRSPASGSSVSRTPVSVTEVVTEYTPYRGPGGVILYAKGPPKASYECRLL